MRRLLILVLVLTSCTAWAWARTFTTGSRWGSGIGPGFAPYQAVSVGTGTGATVDPAPASPYMEFKSGNWTLSDATHVSQWSDSSGNARHATQTTALDQPTVDVNGLLFPAAQSALIAPVAIPLPTSTVVVTFYVPGAERALGSIFSSGILSTTTYVDYPLELPSGSNQEQYYTITGTPVWFSFAGRTGTIVTVGRRFSYPAYSFWVEGVEVSSASSGLGNANNFAGEKMVIGNSCYNLLRSTAMRVICLRVYNRWISDADMATMASWSRTI